MATSLRGAMRACVGSSIKRLFSLPWSGLVLLRRSNVVVLAAVPQSYRRAGDAKEKVPHGEKDTTASGVVKISTPTHLFFSAPSREPLHTDDEIPGQCPFPHSRWRRRRAHLDCLAQYGVLGCPDTVTSTVHPPTTTAHALLALLGPYQGPAAD
ncbi:hypothetical protein COCSADRAFT_341369 [Bipolaris sorokiniana ND90Pr]|jgi:hypothetical protein|uniref:Uncharacterized protein n=1 Tax=Cochliobolus sativus (strain ND90Pr / ATCC 201652) TaxID=665912 RepID=M2TJT7_COCSN|nr:uncharacterized protein COCSADRAFT_341369 [Bipolaris sorokiniana ND90Pr]EMD69441.1 hypothetical protein COCSADRAFT_341369 [Bipolaris sorokiniana ND90Pr]